jgi:hypothetical protein
MHDEPTLGSQVRPDPPALDPSWSRYPIVSHPASPDLLPDERPG